MATWLRRGECVSCGYCCRFPFDPIALFFPKGNPKLEAFLKIRGFVTGSNGGQKGQYSLALAYQKCPFHVDEKCSIFDKPERPEMCHEFPVTPAQVRNTPCSYWFVDEEGIEKPVGGEGSPYPTGNLGMAELPEGIDPQATVLLGQGMIRT